MTTTQAPSPLLESTGLPRFDAIRPEHVEPAVRSLLEALGATVARLQDDPAAPTWDNFVQPWKTTVSASAAPGASPPTCTA